jgi:sortase A
VTQPLDEDALKKQILNDKEKAQANADILAEFAAKTSALTETVYGQDIPANRVLDIDSKSTNQEEDLYTLKEDPVISQSTGPDTNHAVKEEATPAVDLIRAKLNRLFGEEPDAEIEATEAQASTQRSPHQEFMYNLTTSGKSLADIQTRWHEYYIALSNDAKHEVWQEFYKNQGAASAFNQKKAHDREVNRGNKHHAEASRSGETKPQSNAPQKPRSKPRGVKAKVSNTISANGRLDAKDHLKSFLFGLGVMSVAGLFILFFFFNQVFVAPFISPSKSVSATPIIGSITTPIGPESKIIIPKINLEVPVVYDIGSIAEDAVQNALEDGVVHYATTPDPGEQGNSVIVGHSSNNILNSGKYKFAFVLLNRLDEGDTFFIHKDGVRYTYKIYATNVVPPSDVSVLGPADRPNSMTLITCDPPGTSTNRLIIVAEQISPDPSSNGVADIDTDIITEGLELPSDAPSLFSRLWPF